jgi:hypothetical protein
LFREPPELFVICQLRPHLAEDFSPDELRGLFPAVNIIELVVGPVSAWLFGVFTPTAGLSADIVLAGEAAWAHRSVLLESGFNGGDLGFQFIDPSCSLHIP